MRRRTLISRALQRGLIDPFRFYVAPPPALPTIADDNAVDVDEGTSTAPWTVVAGAGNLTQSGSEVTLTNTGASATARRTFAAMPSTTDFIVYIKARAGYTSTKFDYFNFSTSGTDVFDIIFGYDYETTNAALLGCIGMYDYATGTGKNFATGVTYSTAQELAIHVDRNRGAVSMYRKVSGKWDFCNSFPYAGGYVSMNRIEMRCRGSLTFDYVLFAKPNLLAIGDSICAGHTLFDPNPSVYTGVDNYSSTWMRQAQPGLYASLRNTMIVNKGKGGETSATTQGRIAEATAHGARVVFLHASTNDQAGSVSQTTRTSNIQSSINSINTAGASAILLNGMYGTSSAPDNTPSPLLRDYQLAWWNSYRPGLTGVNRAIDIAAAVNSGGFESASLAQSDGLHPNVAGYQAIGDYIVTNYV